MKPNYTTLAAIEERIFAKISELSRLINSYNEKKDLSKYTSEDHKKMGDLSESLGEIFTKQEFIKEELKMLEEDEIQSYHKLIEILKSVN